MGDLCNIGRDSSICIIGVREGENRSEKGNGEELAKSWGMKLSHRFKMPCKSCILFDALYIIQIKRNSYRGI